MVECQTLNLFDMGSNPITSTQYIKKVEEIIYAIKTKTHS